MDLDLPLEGFPGVELRGDLDLSHGQAGAPGHGSERRGGGLHGGISE